VSLSPAIDFVMRGGSNPDPEMDEWERRIAETAFQRFSTNPVFAERGLRWTYNWTHFNTFWMSKNQKIIDLLSFLFANSFATFSYRLFPLMLML